MTTALRELAVEAAEVSGAAPPALLAADHPTLAVETSGSLYFVGVIGGKDVGKSSLVNALAGTAIAEVSSHGEGTDTVLAYAHRSRCAEVLEYLREHVDEHASVVPHDLPHLVSQVLLDLPDIDSLHDAHIAVTRRALRHLLFPLWAQSVEKYADLAPRKLLAAVAEGNDPANFTFVLTKADQLRADSAGAVGLRDDYARRLASTLKLPEPPRVYLTSAVKADTFDLPALREKLAREKPADSVTQAGALALARQDQSVLKWFDALRLDEQAERLARLERDASERIVDRVGRSVLDRAVVALQDDPGPRSSAADEALGCRAAHWPVVGLVHVSLAPLAVMMRRFASPPATTPALVNSHLPARELSTAIQTTFAHLDRTYPGMANNPGGKLWESMPADVAVGELRHLLIDTIDRRRNAAVAQAGAAPAWLAPFRWLLTVGALLWFPLGQPILEALMQRDHPTLHELAFTVIRMLSVAHLLESLTFLVAYFVIVYLLLRRGTHRRVARLFEDWDRSDDSMSLSGQSAMWLDQLTAGIGAEREKVESLVERSREFRHSAHTR